MLQFIANTSIIWLTFLLLYELLLRKESFHQYNRIYLVVTLIAGLTLPMVNFEGLMPSAPITLRRPVSQIHGIKETMKVPELNQIPVTNSNSIVYDNIPVILWCVYMAGVLMGTILILREAVILFRLYNSGHKQEEDEYTIVETGKDHCAFSLFKTIFVSSRQEYNDAQWILLIKHEKEHARQWHSLDNMFLLALRILFWFHPLPHIYYNRLRIVHEFQADDAAALNNADYGTFLLQQSLLQGAPALTHSFNYSPIKTRIAMLTGTKSKRAKLVKYTAALPLLLLLLLFCTQTSISGEIRAKDNKVHFKGNEITFGELKVIPYDYRKKLEQQKAMFMYTTLPDSVPIKDWSTGYIKMMKVTSDLMPVAINGKPVLGNEEQYWRPANADVAYQAPVFTGPENNIDAYLFALLKDDLDKLENGGYTLQVNRMVIDDAGTLAYYEVEGIQMFSAPTGEKRDIKNNIKQAINSKLASALASPIKFQPAIKDGKPVNARLTPGKYEIVVRDHKAILTERTGC